MNNQKNNKPLTFDTDTFDECGPIPVLKEFELQQCPKISVFSTVSIYGKRKTGKSVWIKWFLQAFKHMIPWFWTFTKTKFNSFWESFMPGKFIIGNFSADVLQEIMDRQVTAIDAAMEVPPDQSINFLAGINWDDYMGNEIRFNRKLEEFYFTGRHYGTLNCYAAQHITMTPPAIRSNTDMAVLFATDYKDSLEHYYKDFAGRLESFKVFKRLFEVATCKPHHFLCVVNDPNVPYEEKFFVGKAEFLKAKKKYILGCEEYWADSSKQLESIASGDMQKRMDRMRFYSEWQTPRKMTFLMKKNQNANQNAKQEGFSNESSLVAANLPDIEE